MRNRSPYKALGIILVAMAIIGIIFFFVKNRNNEPSVNVDELLSENASALYEKSNRLEVNQGTATLIAEDGTRTEIGGEAIVSVGTTIEINNGSTATLYWFDGSISRLAAGTEITIDKADYNPENISESDINFNVVKGEVWSKVVNLVDENSEFLSYSGGVVAGVRGSSYNFISKDGEIEVESIEHAAFIGTRNEKTNEIEDPTVITSGEKATANEEEVTGIQNIPQADFERTWIRENKRRDERAIELLQKKNLARIRELAGPLPGDPNYEKKNELIEEKLADLKDPEEKAKAEAEVARMRIYETIALIASNQESSVSEVMEMMSESIEEANMPESEKNRLRKQMQNEMKTLDRAMEGILADNPELYALREQLREKQVELETDSDKKERLQEKLLERQLYELSDLAEKGGVPPSVLEDQIEKYQKHVDAMSERMEENGDFKLIHTNLMQRLENIPEAQRKALIDRFENLPERAKQQIKEAVEEKTVDQLREKVKTEIKKEVQREVVEEAPSRKGPSAPPTPAPRKVIEQESGAHKGPSNV